MLAHGPRHAPSHCSTTADSACPHRRRKSLTKRSAPGGALRLPSQPSKPCRHQVDGNLTFIVTSAAAGSACLMCSHSAASVMRDVDLGRASLGHPEMIILMAGVRRQPDARPRPFAGRSSFGDGPTRIAHSGRSGRGKAVPPRRLGIDQPKADCERSLDMREGQLGQRSENSRRQAFGDQPQQDVGKREQPRPVAEGPEAPVAPARRRQSRTHRAAPGAIRKR